MDSCELCERPLIGTDPDDWDQLKVQWHGAITAVSLGERSGLACQKKMAVLVAKMHIA